MSPCVVCGKPSDALCGRCRGRRYCGVVCQGNDWLLGGHKGTCKPNTLFVVISGDAWIPCASGPVAPGHCEGLIASLQPLYGPTPREVFAFTTEALARDYRARLMVAAAAESVEEWGDDDSAHRKEELEARARRAESRYVVSSIAIAGGPSRAEVFSLISSSDGCDIFRGLFPTAAAAAATHAHDEARMGGQLENLIERVTVVAAAAPSAAVVHVGGGAGQ